MTTHFSLCLFSYIGDYEANTTTQELTC